MEYEHAACVHSQVVSTVVSRAVKTPTPSIKWLLQSPWLTHLASPSGHSLLDRPISAAVSQRLYRRLGEVKTWLKPIELTQTNLQPWGVLSQKVPILLIFFPIKWKQMEQMLLVIIIINIPLLYFKILFYCKFVRKPPCFSDEGVSLLQPDVVLQREPALLLYHIRRNMRRVVLYLFGLLANSKRTIK